MAVTWAAAAQGSTGHLARPGAARPTVPVDKSRLGLEGFTGPQDYPALVAALEARGYTGERLEAITSGNWLRVLRAGLPA